MHFVKTKCRRTRFCHVALTRIDEVSLFGGIVRRCNVFGIVFARAAQRRSQKGTMMPSLCSGNLASGAVSTVIARRIAFAEARKEALGGGFAKLLLGVQPICFVCAA